MSTCSNDGLFLDMDMLICREYKSFLWKLCNLIDMCVRGALLRGLERGLCVGLEIAAVEPFMISRYVWSRCFVKRRIKKLGEGLVYGA